MGLQEGSRVDRPASPPVCAVLGEGIRRAPRPRPPSLPQASARDPGVRTHPRGGAVGSEGTACPQGGGRTPCAIRGRGIGPPGPRWRWRPGGAGALGRDDIPLGACQRLRSGREALQAPRVRRCPLPRPCRVGLSGGGAGPGRAAACVCRLLPGFSGAGLCPGSPLPQAFVLTGNVVLLEGGASGERGRAGGTPGTSVGLDGPGGQLRSHLGQTLAFSRMTLCPGWHHNT